MYTLLGIFNLLTAMVLMAFGIKNVAVGYYLLALLEFAIAGGNLFFAWLAIINLINEHD